MLLAMTASVLVASSTAAVEARDRYFDIRKNFADERIVGATFVHIGGMDPLATPWTVGVKGTAIAPPDISFIISKTAPGAAPASPLDRVKAAPGCALDAATLASCIDTFAGTIGAVDKSIAAAADSEQGVQRRSSHIVQMAADVTDPKVYDALRTNVSSCILEDSSSAVCPTRIARASHSSATRSSAA